MHYQKSHESGLNRCAPAYKAGALPAELSWQMRSEGLEPPRREAPAPKAGAATNYATNALSGQGGIRTPGTFQYGAFQEHCNQPLCHLSK